MSERLSRIFLKPDSRSSLTMVGRTAPPTPTASRPSKTTMATSFVLRTEIFMRDESYRRIAKHEVASGRYQVRRGMGVILSRRSRGVVGGAAAKDGEGPSSRQSGS